VTVSLTVWIQASHLPSVSLGAGRGRSDGLFPAAVMVQPRPLVGHTRWVGADVGYVGLVRFDVLPRQQGADGVADVRLPVTAFVGPTEWESHARGHLIGDLR
jgi:hypothetical protein